MKTLRSFPLGGLEVSLLAAFLVASAALGAPRPVAREAPAVDRPAPVAPVVPPRAPALRGGSE